MTKKIFQDLTPHERLIALKENAYETKNETVRRNFTADEISAKKTNLSENTMMLLDEEETLKEVSAVHRKKIKEFKGEIKSDSWDIRKGYYENNEDVFCLMNDQEQMMEVFDKNGELLYARPLKPNEKQLKLKTA